MKDFDGFLRRESWHDKQRIAWQHAGCNIAPRILFATKDHKGKDWANTLKTSNSKYSLLQTVGSFIHRLTRVWYVLQIRALGIQSALSRDTLQPFALLMLDIHHRDVHEIADVIVLYTSQTRVEGMTQSWQLMIVASHVLLYCAVTI